MNISRYTDRHSTDDRDCDRAHSGTAGQPGWAPHPGHEGIWAPVAESSRGTMRSSWHDDAPPGTFRVGPPVGRAAPESAPSQRPLRLPPPGLNTTGRPAAGTGSCRVPATRVGGSVRVTVVFEVSTDSVIVTVTVTVTDQTAVWQLRLAVTAAARRSSLSVPNPGLRKPSLRLAR